MGSSSFSRMSRSTCVSSPMISNRTSFPSCRAKSRTSRGNRRAQSPKGRIRHCNTSRYNRCARFAERRSYISKSTRRSDNSRPHSAALRIVSFTCSPMWPETMSAVPANHAGRQWTSVNQPACVSIAAENLRRDATSALQSTTRPRVPKAGSDFAPSNAARGRTFRFS